LEGLWLGGSDDPDELLVELAHLMGGQPLGEALELALGGDADAVNGVEVTEPLVEGAAGELAGEAAEVVLNQCAKEVASEGAAGALLEAGLLGSAREGFGTGEPGVQSQLDEEALDACVAEKGVDVLKLAAQGEVVDIAENVGKPGSEVLRKGKDLTWHAASV